MDTNCAPLVADLFLYCYGRDFMLSLSDDNQSEIIETFISTSRYLVTITIKQYFLIAWPVTFTITSQIPKPHFWIYIYLSNGFV